MDGYEATRIVFSRIQNLEPENASRIMGLLLIQDHGEKEMIRLAFGPEALLHSVILKAKKELGLPANSPSTPSTPSSPSPFLANNPSPVTLSRQNSSASRFLGNGGVNLPSSLSIPPNSSSSSGSSCWSALSDLPNPDELISPSSGSLNPSSLPFYGNGGVSDMIDEFQLQDQLSFLNESSPQLNSKNHDLFYPQAADLSSSSAAAACGSTDAMGFPSYWGSSFHRSSSVSDILGADDPASGFGWRPCLYFARGYCKNGNNCKFVHGALGESGSMVAAPEGANMVGSPNKIEMMDQCHELLRSKSAQQQRAAAAAALMMGDDMSKFNRSRLERSGFSMNGEAGMVNPASRQIYLTFPADSTFREEDVSNYFSIYGPVQDVRIPYQQKRMFGFVTFVYPETVKIILAKGNPHFVCDARVLVKPYKEKGKIPDKKQQQQQVERDFSPCGSATGLDSRDPFDLHLGARAFYNNQDMLWRRKLEDHADLQQALELQNRRLMGLQLLDVKKHHHHRALSSGSPIPSPTHSPNLFGRSLVLPQFHTSQEAPQENCSSPMLGIPVTAPEKQAVATATAITAGKELPSTEDNGSGKGSPHSEDGAMPESLEHNLPDSPFASPTKASGEYFSAFSNLEVDKGSSVSASTVNNNWVSSALLPANNALDIASFNSFNCQMPRFSSGHGTIGMDVGTGGPTCPVGI
ncbi:hypothetical protein DITRI_Ditri20bG0105700 [Diplodiscus trichospermus]